MTQTQEKHKFEAEVSQILDLVINSLYSNNDIFLRELISNASDALDKLKFEALTNSELDASNSQIGLAINKEARQIIISDNGIGMDEEEMIRNLGTIAKSGTKEFIQAIKNTDSDKQLNANLIGQFGVGFYSAFIVASQVRVISRKAGSNLYASWSSDAKGEFETQVLSQQEILEYKVEDLKQGTKIFLNIKQDEDCNDYLEEWKLRSIVKEYSDFIEYPIKMRSVDSENPDTFVWETINSQKALWLKNKSEISEEEYKEFYKHLSHDFSNPLDWIHYSVEGTNEFTALLYIPEKAPFDLFLPEKKKALSLYINKVFISSEAELLLPQYLRFVKGLVDASDLPLNVSRELLQANPKLSNIKKNLCKKILGKLAEIANQDSDKYNKFYREFGKVLKEGVHSDFANKDKILDLLLYESSYTEAGTYTKLADYVSRAGQNNNIYYITGESRAELENSPYLESLKAKGLEVLFMTDAVDEWVVMSGAEYQGKIFKSVTKGSIDNDENQKKNLESKESEYKDLLTKIKDNLGDKIKDVKFSDRLVTTLACLVTDENDLSANLEKIYKNANQKIPSAKRTLELNPNHRVLAKLQNLFTENPNSSEISRYSNLIYGQALLLEGSPLPNLKEFIDLVTELM